MNRIIAILGACVIYFPIYIVVGFTINRMTDGMSKTTELIGMVVGFLFPIPFAASSYRASMKKHKKTLQPKKSEQNES